MRLSDLVAWEHISDKNHNKLQLHKLYKDNKERIERAPGSQVKHHAWQGGYLTHIEQCSQIALRIYEPLNNYSRLPFTLEDVMIVLLIHDLEKPFKYVEPKQTILREQTHKFVEKLLKQYEITLTKEQQNAFTYIHGEGDDYSATQNIQNELAAFCHSCDTLSARIYHDKRT
jgi:hypothetical protein